MKQMATAFSTPFDSEGRGVVKDAEKYVQTRSPATGS
jgi:hypothetical protein